MIGIRVNTLKSTQDEVVKALSGASGSFDVVPWSEHALVVSGIEMKDLTEFPEYQQGLFAIQNLSSQIPALVLAPEQGETILDLCAAPGSKTSQLAALMENTGTIIANDVSRDRLYKLRAQCERLGVTNVETRLGEGRFAWRKLSAAVDRVLVDVPCSMGLPIAPKNLKFLVEKQKHLLRSALACAKPGGIVIYSTCSPRIEENEAVIAWMMKKQPELVIESIERSGIPEGFRTQEGFLRVPGSDSYGAFFVAKLRIPDAS